MSKCIFLEDPINKLNGRLGLVDILGIGSFLDVEFSVTDACLL